MRSVCRTREQRLHKFTLLNAALTYQPTIYQCTTIYFLSTRYAFYVNNTNIYIHVYFMNKLIPLIIIINFRSCAIHTIDYFF